MLFLIALGALSTSVFAVNLPGTSFSLTSNVSYTSEYIYRGVSESNGDPAIQGGFDLSHTGGFYAGVWSSNVAWGNLHLEMDFYGGYRGEIANMMRYDLSAFFYRYPGATDGDDNWKYDEYAIAFSKDLGPVDATLSLNYSPAYFDDAGKTYYTKIQGRMPISDPLAVSASIGWTNVSSDEKLDSYTDYLASLSYTFNNYTLAVTYTNTSLSADMTTAGPAAVVSLTASL
jgi:uncharacterized protein (TIGR02001 family)